MASRGRMDPIRPNPPRVRARPVYEEFSPISEWKQEPQSQILLIYLPGFKKEQIKVATEGINTLRVRGERQIGYDKWNRFQKEYRVPEDCNIRAVRAKFEGGTLTITMPKNTTSVAQVATKAEAEETSNATRRVDDKSLQSTSSKETSSTTKYPKGQDDFPPKATSTISEAKQKTDGKGLEEATPQKATAEPKSQKDRGKTSLVPTSSTNATTIVQKTGANQQTDGKGLEELTTEKATRAEPKWLKDRGETPPAPTSSTNAATTVQKTEAKQQTDGKGLAEPITQKATAEPKSQKGRGETSPIQTVVPETIEAREGSEGKEKPIESKMPENASKEKESRSEKGKGSIEPENFTTATVNKEKEDIKESTASARTEKAKDYSDVAKEKQTRGASYGPVAMRSLKEQRQLIVNMGVAILVIVALGAYVSYTMQGSSGKTEH